MNRKIKITLFASIGLNILLVGFLLGQCSSKAMFRGDGPRGMHHKEKMLLKALPKEKRELGREAFEEMKEARDKNFSFVKEKKKKLKEIAIAKDFNKENFLSALKDLDESFTATKRESDVKIADFLSKLTQDERIKLVKKFDKMHKRGGHHGHKGPKGH